MAKGDRAIDRATLPILFNTFTLAALVATVWAGWRFCRAAVLWLRQDRASGIVVAARMARMHPWDSEPDPRVTVRYELPDGRSVEKEMGAPLGGRLVGHSERSLMGQRGRRVTVRYDPSHPGRASLRPGRDLVQEAVLLVICAVLLIGLLN